MKYKYALTMEVKLKIYKSEQENITYNLVVISDLNYPTKEDFDKAYNYAQGKIASSPYFVSSIIFIGYNYVIGETKYEL